MSIKYILRWKTDVNMPTETYLFDVLSLSRENTRIRFNNGSIEIKDFIIVETEEYIGVHGTYVKGGSGDWNIENLTPPIFNAYSNPKMEIELDYEPNSSQYNSTYFDLIEELPSYNISYTLTHIAKSSDAPSTIDAGVMAHFTLTTDNGYKLPTTISCLGATCVYTPNENYSTALISLSNATSNVTFSASASLANYNITYNLTGIENVGVLPTSATINDSYNLTFVCNKIQYQLPQSIDVTGEAFHTWNYDTGVLTISNINSDITINISASEITDKIELGLYQNSAKDNKLDKSANLLFIGRITGILREECSLTDPVFTIEYSKINFNYIYIPLFNRYYYITDIVSIKNTLWEISLHVDVLMSYKDKIKQQVCFIDRQENNFNANIIDDNRVVEQGYDVEVLDVNNTFLIGPSDTYNYVLLGFGVGTGGTL